LQPIIVRPAGEGNENYTIVAGSRFNASKALGRMEITSRIVEADDKEKQVQTKASDLENVVKEQRVELKQVGIRFSNLNPTTGY